jgi:hypothetical protein
MDATCKVEPIKTYEHLLRLHLGTDMEAKDGEEK